MGFGGIRAVARAAPVPGFMPCMAGTGRRSTGLWSRRLCACSPGCLPASPSSLAPVPIPRALLRSLAQAENHEELGRLLQKQKDYRRAQAEFEVGAMCGPGGTAQPMQAVAGRPPPGHFSMRIGEAQLCIYWPTLPCPALKGRVPSILHASQRQRPSAGARPQAALALVGSSASTELLGALGLCQVSQGDLRVSWPRRACCGWNRLCRATKTALPLCLHLQSLLPTFAPSPPGAEQKGFCNSSCQYCVFAPAAPLCRAGGHCRLRPGAAAGAPEQRLVAEPGHGFEGAVLGGASRGGGGLGLSTGGRGWFEKVGARGQGSQGTGLLPASSAAPLQPDWQANNQPPWAPSPAGAAQSRQALLRRWAHRGARLPAFGAGGRHISFFTT